MERILIAVALLALNLSATGLKFNENNFILKTASIDGKEIKFRAYEGIIYVANPVDTEYQKLNFYAPSEYFDGKKIGKFDAKNAPIFLPNAVGGYMPATAGVPEIDKRTNKPNAILQALARGYVVAAPAARGRTLVGADGKFSGKAPSVIVDLKAAVRYLKFNDKEMVGDANKIISNGTSAGGAMSLLLGVSGDEAVYEPYLRALKAADASDKIFAVSAYCPILNLENANAAYEWMFGDVKEYEKMDFSKLDAKGFNDRSNKPPLTKGEITDAQIALSKEIRPQFIGYVNSLNLKDESGKILRLDESGNGSFKDYLGNVVLSSFKNSKNVQTPAWIKDGKVDFDAYVKAIKRSKTPLAFDDIDLQTPENNLFGDADTKAKHFSEFALEKSKQKLMADANIIRLMNPMNFIQNKNAAKFYRIRHGEIDRDTALAIPAIAALALQNSGKNVDFASPWGVPHSGDYDLDELFDWIDEVVKK